MAVVSTPVGGAASVAMPGRGAAGNGEGTVTLAAGSVSEVVAAASTEGPGIASPETPAAFGGAPRVGRAVGVRPANETVAAAEPPPRHSPATISTPQNRLPRV